MMVSPFIFYRGAAKIMAADLKETPTAGADAAHTLGQRSRSGAGRHFAPRGDRAAVPDQEGADGGREDRRATFQAATDRHRVHARQSPSPRRTHPPCPDRIVSGRYWGCEGPTARWAGSVTGLWPM
jgi:hypothetical protein